MDASKCITNRPKTNNIKGNYDNKTELSLNYQIWLTCIKVGSSSSKSLLYVTFRHKRSFK